MKTKAEIEAKIREVSHELAGEMGEIPWEGEYGSPFAALEARAAEIGDMLTREVAAQRARIETEKRPPDSECCCPKCNGPGDRKRLRQRELQTVRGTIELTEPEYHCKKCRRSFFPSDSLARS